ncbi:MAG TPA: hypothetical protein VG370_24005 [Chloroflexota bacterium]|nr:hypothetical protein [Chloroflexota bacterium]
MAGGEGDVLAELLAAGRLEADVGQGQGDLLFQVDREAGRDQGAGRPERAPVVVGQLDVDAGEDVGRDQVEARRLVDGRRLVEGGPAEPVAEPAAAAEAAPRDGHPRLDAVPAHGLTRRRDRGRVVVER